MVVRVLLLLLAILMLPGDVMADGAAWRKSKVVVRDYTPEAWKHYVADMVIAFNEMLPESAPRLVYRPQPERPCAEINRKHERGKIAVCTGSFDSETILSYADGTIQSALIRLFPDTMPTHRHSFVCHEMMHAITDAPDDYSYPHPETSCVVGDADFPGSWDIAYARKVYRKRHR